MTNLGTHARREKRTTVRLFGNLKYMNMTLHCRVVDLSEKGIGLKMEKPQPMTIGIPVTFNGPELGHLTGVVTWCRNDTVGLRLNHTSSTYAQVKSYFRFFHEDIVPVLQR